MSYDISATDISKALGVSRSTIHRRLCEYGISVSSAWTDLRDEEVDAIIGRTWQVFQMLDIAACISSFVLRISKCRN